MKKYLNIILLLILSSCHTKWHERDSDAYLRLPNLQMLLLDSTTTLYTTQLAEGKATILFYFSPDCEHCQAETGDLLSNVKVLGNINLVFISSAPITEIQKFSHAFNLSQYSSIKVGYDYKFEFYNMYKISFYPCLIIYNKNRFLEKLYIGETEMDKIVKALRS